MWAFWGWSQWGPMHSGALSSSTGQDSLIHPQHTACPALHFRIRFDDLHHFGIYSWELLYHLGTHKVRSQPPSHPTLKQLVGSTNFGCTDFCITPHPNNGSPNAICSVQLSVAREYIKRLRARGLTRDPPAAKQPAGAGRKAPATSDYGQKGCGSKQGGS